MTVSIRMQIAAHLRVYISAGYSQNTHNLPLAVVIRTSGMLTGIATERATSARIASIIAPPSVERGGCAAAGLSAA